MDTMRFTFSDTIAGYVTRFDRKPWTIRALGLVLRAAYGRAPRSRRGQP